MTLRVGIVARTLNVRHLRGTGRYVQELLKNTVAADDISWTAYGHDPTIPFRVPSSLIGTTDVFDFRGDRFQLWEQLGLPARARRAGIQLLHCAENTLPIWQPVPTVVTIHDTVPWSEKCPTWLEQHYLHDVQGLAFRRCSAVITISESSRRDIAARWPFLADRITVVPHGIGDEFFEAASSPLPAALQASIWTSPYLLYLGGPQPRKRFAWALDLLARCGQNDLHLVACGFSAGTAPERELPRELQGRVHFAPFVQDGELVTLYRGARAAVYPTLYEGFGFPAVEAQASGTPILFSPISSLVDLVGPMTWPVMPDDFSAWLAALQEILGLPDSVRAARAVKSIEWSRQFSWRKSVEKHLAVYRELLSRT